MRCYEQALARCECCEMMMPYLALACGKAELRFRRGGGIVVVESQVLYRFECPDCREYGDG